MDPSKQHPQQGPYEVQRLDGLPEGQSTASYLREAGSLTPACPAFPSMCLSLRPKLPAAIGQQPLPRLPIDPVPTPVRLTDTGYSTLPPAPRPLDSQTSLRFGPTRHARSFSDPSALATPSKISSLDTRRTPRHPDSLSGHAWKNSQVHQHRRIRKQKMRREQRQQQQVDLQHQRREDELSAAIEAEDILPKISKRKMSL
ncbi:hypothetical protein GGR53DRAFT_467473 [Hypoxylon sp. FL1150]|nr:hypothetical protein GGR53DRAFT_467473 [Hypoxylon sp. FL1150]